MKKDFQIHTVLILLFLFCINNFTKGQAIYSSGRKNYEATIYLDEGKYGLIDYDNNSILKPVYDEITAYKKHNLYLLKKENQYSFIFKQWKNEKNIKEDNWVFQEEFYDSLLFSEKLNVIIYFQEGKYGFINYRLYNTYIQNHTYSLFNSTKTENIYDSVYFENENLLILRKENLYGMRNNYGKIISPQFETPPVYYGRYGRYILIQKNQQYGILPYRFIENQIELPFDEKPVFLLPNRYLARKNNLWGIIFLKFNSEKDKKDYLEAVPFKYEDTLQLKKDFRYVSHIRYNPYSRHDREDPYSSFINRSGGIFTTTIGQPLQLNLIFYETYPKNEYYFQTFIPKWKNQTIIQDSINEFLINEASHFNEYALIKTERNKGMKIVKNYFIRNAARDNDYMGGPVEPYENRKIKGLILYEINRDSIHQIFAFEEEAENISYQILYSSGTGIYYGGRESGFRFVLKTTQLKEKKYKHEFFNYYGELLYSTTSKHPINQWNTIGYPNYYFSYYGKRVCGYNGSRARFFR